MRLAYADPPYPGCAHLYRAHPDYGGEVDHTALVAQLERYDGWALSTSASALQAVLAVCPPTVRVAAWTKPGSAPPGNRGTWWWAWEPVVVRAGRPPREMTRDALAHTPPRGPYRAEVIGAKPPAVAAWIFRLMGAERHDTLDDLFPGSGAVRREWERWQAQPWLYTAPASPRAQQTALEPL